MTNDDMPLSIYGIRPGCHINLKIKEASVLLWTR